MTTTMTLAEWLEVQLAADEAVALDAQSAGIATVDHEHMVRWQPSHVLAHIAAVREVLALHKAWPVLVESQPEFKQADLTDINAMTFRMSKQIAWTTEQAYRDRFGVEPPTSPIIRALAKPYAGRDGYEEVAG